MLGKNHSCSNVLQLSSVSPSLNMSGTHELHSLWASKEIVVTGMYLKGSFNKAYMQMKSMETDIQGICLYDTASQTSVYIQITLALGKMQALVW